MAGAGGVDRAVFYEPDGRLAPLAFVVPHLAGDPALRTSHIQQYLLEAYQLSISYSTFNGWRAGRFGGHVYELESNVRALNPALEEEALGGGAPPDARAAAAYEAAAAAAARADAAAADRALVEVHRVAFEPGGRQLQEELAEIIESFAYHSYASASPELAALLAAVQRLPALGLWAYPGLPDLAPRVVEMLADALAHVHGSDATAELAALVEPRDYAELQARLGRADAAAALARGPRPFIRSCKAPSLLLDLAPLPALRRRRRRRAAGVRRRRGPRRRRPRRARRQDRRARPRPAAVDLRRGRLRRRARRARVQG